MLNAEDRGAWHDWLVVQQQPQVAEQQCLLQHMANKQKAMLDWLMTAQAHASQKKKKLWKQMVKLSLSGEQSL